jgi:hypothetical protein
MPVMRSPQRSDDFAKHPGQILGSAKKQRHREQKHRKIGIGICVWRRPISPPPKFTLSATNAARGHDATTMRAAADDALIPTAWMSMPATMMVVPLDWFDIVD